MPFVDLKKFHITALIGRLNNCPGETIDSLKENSPVEMNQTSPFTISVKIGTLTHQILTYPVPIRHSGKIRIAQKSAYKEVEVPLANYTKNTGFPRLMYPTLFHRDTSPALYNMPYVNFCKLLKIDTKATDELIWLNTHIMQLKSEPRERTLTDPYNDHYDVRTNFKDALLCLFMLTASTEVGRPECLA